MNPQKKFLNDCAIRTPIQVENPISEFLGAAALIGLLVLCLFI